MFNPRRHLWFMLLLAAILTALLVATPAAARGPGGGGGGGGCGGCGGGGGGRGGGGTLVPLSDFEEQALLTAIDEEYYAKAVYQKVTDTFGPISPFTWVIRDEQMHVNWAANLLRKYGIPIPQDRWTGNITLEFTSKQQACQVGADAEIYNASVYDEMLPQITHSDLISSFGRLRDVSRYRHLPAFEQCAAN